MNEKKINPSRTRQEVDELINEWKNSGLGKKQFCIQKELNYQTFVSWFYFRKKGIRTKKGFIPVQVQTSPTGVFAEIQLSTSRKIIFHQPVGLEILQAVLKC
jgi:hypothetical protein